MNNSCGVCRFFDADESHLGECRRRAPSMDSNQEDGIWPKVFSEDWCGEYESRPAAKRQAAKEPGFMYTLELTQRARTTLLKMGLQSLAEMAACTDADFLRTEGCGVHTLADIHHALSTARAQLQPYRRNAP